MASFGGITGILNHLSRSRVFVQPKCVKCDISELQIESPASPRRDTLKQKVQDTLPMQASSRPSLARIDEEKESDIHRPYTKSELETELECRERSALVTKVTCAFTLNEALLTRVVQNFASLSELAISPVEGDESQITGEAFSSLPQTSLLEKMDANGCTHITDGYLGEFLQKATRVKELYLRATTISGTAFQHMPKNMSLRRVDLSESSITDEGVAALLEQAPQLKELSVAYCRNVTKRAFIHLPRENSLTKIDLTGCYIESEEGELEGIKNKRTRIEFLDGGSSGWR